MAKKDQNSFYDIKESSFSDKWGTYKYLTDIQSDIKEDITSDFILAKLNENQKESVIELVRDAYFVKKEIEKLALGYRYRPLKNGKYMKNKDGTFKRFDLTRIEQKYIEKVAKITFNSFMIKIIMTKIEYRNVENNVMMELITEKDKMSAENSRLEEENKDLLKRMKNNIKKGSGDDER